MSKVRWTSWLLILSLSMPAHAVFELTLPSEPERARNLYWPPLVSFVLPGFDQWVEGQYPAASVYTGIAGGGLLLSANAARGLNRQSRGSNDFETMSDLERQFTYGLQLYSFSGMLSAYHSFRSAVTSRPDQFNFLPKNETTADLLLAPFAFEEALRPTTFLPLLGGLALVLAAKPTLGQLNVNDLAFTSGISYNAGVGEEALFRGYMMPMLHHNLDNRFWSNALSAALFGAAHITPGNPRPYFQTLAGFYFGWLTQRNKWSLRQAVFLHTWWDVMVIGLSIADQRASRERYIPLPSFSFEF